MKSALTLEAERGLWTEQGRALQMPFDGKMKRVWHGQGPGGAAWFLE